MTDTKFAAGPGGVETLRVQVDKIDSQILDLLIERAGLSGAIAAAKLKQPGAPAIEAGALAMRPAREVQVLRRLLEMAQGRLDPALVVETWRGLMTSNLRSQTPFDVWVAPGADPVVIWDLARRHFGGGAPLNRAIDARGALQKVIENPLSIAVLPFPGSVGSGGWWPILVESKSADLRIVAALPCHAETGKPPEAAVVARIALEPAGQDETLLISLDERGRAPKMLQESGLKAEEIERARAQALYRIPEFVSENDERIQFARGRLDGLRVVGSFSRVV
ncbi:MAG: chorismate mutase [Caulobacterales bacterium]